MKRLFSTGLIALSVAAIFPTIASAGMQSSKDLVNEVRQQWTHQHAPALHTGRSATMAPLPEQDRGAPISPADKEKNELRGVDPYAR